MKHHNKHRHGSPASVLMAHSSGSGSNYAHTLMGKGHDRQFAEGGEVPNPRVPVNTQQQMLKHGGPVHHHKKHKSLGGRMTGPNQMTREDHNIPEARRHGTTELQHMDRHRRHGGPMKKGGKAC